MEEAPRLGTPKKCGACLSEDLEYLGDRSGKCRRCGSVTQPYWAARTWSFGTPSPRRPEGSVPVAKGAPCLRCGYVSPPGWPSCASCGTPIGEGAVFVEERPTLTIAQREGAAQTKTGVSLLGSAFVLSWIPWIEFLAGFLMLVGIVYVFVGRKAFGSDHTRNVYNATVLFIAAALGSAYMGVVSIQTGVSLFSPGAANAVGSWTSTIVYGSLVVFALRAYALLLIPFALGKPLVRAYLFGAVCAYLVVGILYVWTFSQALDGAVITAFSRNDTGPLLAVAQRMDGWRYMFAIPSIFLAGAYYMVWRRINRGELPVAAVPAPVAT